MSRLSVGRSILISFGLHALVIAGVVALAWLGWLAWSVDDELLDSTSSQDAAVTEGSAEPDPLDKTLAGDMNPADFGITRASDVTPASTRRLLSASLEKAEQMSPDEQLAQIDKLQAQVATYAPDNVNTIASIAESGFGVDSQIRQRAYEPDPTATGRFDASSSLLYDIETWLDPVTNMTQYRFTYVDADGRSLVDTRPSDRVSPEEIRMARIYAMARKNPQMRSLLNSVSRIYLATERDRQTESTDASE